MDINEDRINRIEANINLIQRQTSEILRQLFNKTNVIRVENIRNQATPEVMRILKIYETPEGSILVVD